MANPNKIPISKIGRKLITGPVCSTLSSELNQPHSKTAAVTPKAAADTEEVADGGLEWHGHRPENHRQQ